MTVVAEQRSLSVVTGGLDDVQLIRIQRARIVAAMLDVALELGAASASVADVVARSGVSRRTFYEIFTDREDCFLAAFEDALERLAAVALPAYRGEASGADVARPVREWHERIRMVLTEILCFLEENPGAGRLLFVESLAAGPRVLERRNMVLARLAGAVEEGREESGGPEGLPALTGEGVVGGVCAILYSRLLAASSASTNASHAGDRKEAFVDLTSPLSAMIVLPYLGKAAARRELERPIPAHRASSPRDGGGYPFRELGMRLTYRTLRTLEAIASNPEASNRTLGEVSGINDQGQISKLLSRLQPLGLVENVIGSPGQGGPNAWCLTEKGRTIHNTIQASKGR